MASLLSKRALVNFHVVEKLAPEIILGYEFCHLYGEAIVNRKRTVKVDGAKVPIVLNPSGLPRQTPPLHTDRQYFPSKGTANDRLKADERAYIRL